MIQFRDRSKLQKIVNEFDMWMFKQDHAITNTLTLSSLTEDERKDLKHDLIVYRIIYHKWNSLVTDVWKEEAKESCHGSSEK